MWGICRYGRSRCEPDDMKFGADHSVNSQCNSELDAAVAAEYREAAATVGRSFVPVYLRMSRGENFQRIASSSRVTLGTEELVDPSDLLLVRNIWDLFKLSGVEGLHLDVTDIDAE